MRLTARVKEKKIYREYAEKLIKDGWAYYAFDTAEELEIMRTSHRTITNPAPQYDHQTRMHMRNSINVGPEETEKLLAGQNTLCYPD